MENNKIKRRKRALERLITRAINLEKMPGKTRKQRRQLKKIETEILSTHKKI